MTLFEATLTNTIPTTTVAGETLVSSTTVDDEDVLSSSICMAITTGASSIHVPDVNIQFIHEAEAIVETMSDEDLARYSEILEGKQAELDQVEKNKILIIEPKQQ